MPEQLVHNTNINQIQPTNEDLVKQYKKQINQGCLDVADKIMWRIVENNMGTIVGLVHDASIEHRNVTKEDVEDLKQESIIAVMEAVKTYDERLARFNTHAHNKVLFAIRDWFEKKHGLIRIPKEKRRDCSIYNSIVNTYKELNGGKIPSDKYIQMQMGVDDDTFCDIRAALNAQNIDSLSREVEKKDETDNKVTLGDTIADEKDAYSDERFCKNKKLLAEYVLQLRDYRERKVIFDYYYKDRSLVEIAEDFKVSKQRVNTIKNNALKHLFNHPGVRAIAEDTDIL